MSGVLCEISIPMQQTQFIGQAWYELRAWETAISKKGTFENVE